MKERIHACLETLHPVAGGVRAVFRFPADLEVFAGHFPGKPLLPGIFLIEATRHAAERATGNRLAIRCVEEAKFTAEVKPGDTVTVEALLAQEEGGWRCDASLLAAQAQVARIRLDLVTELPH